MNYGLVTRLADGASYVSRFETLNAAFAALRDVIRRRDARAGGRIISRSLRGATFAICELDYNGEPTGISLRDGVVDALIDGHIFPNDDEEMARDLFDQFRKSD
jgi:hypothetical protein